MLLPQANGVEGDPGLATLLSGAPSVRVVDADLQRVLARGCRDGYGKGIAEGIVCGANDGRRL